jgi:antitoxin (DNA-binding transcriptional repressor) of toxin-antitoxin stability system
MGSKVMSSKITASELDRSMSDVLNRVAYQGESFIIERGGREIARLEPVGPRPGVTAREVADKLRYLSVPEGLADDLEVIRAGIPRLGEPEWLR